MPSILNIICDDTMEMGKKEFVVSCSFPCTDCCAQGGLGVNTAQQSPTYVIAYRMSMKDTTTLLRYIEYADDNFCQLHQIGG
jgi:hypothetical protein